MASIAPTDTVDVADSASPDTVEASVRRWRLTPLRERQGTTPPDYSDNGLDVFVHGDPDADGDNVSVYVGIADAQRNGLKRAYNDAGTVTLWAEPAPQTYDTAGTSAGILGTTAGPAGAAGNEIDLGVAASHSISNPASGFPLVVRPVITVAGARYESALATLRAVMTTTVDGGTPSESLRDLFFGYGGSSTIALPAVTVDPGGSYELECDLKLIYRQAVADAFEIAVAGVQVLFQVTEYSSTGS